jgi:hypothetical protein
LSQNEPLDPPSERATADPPRFPSRGASWTGTAILTQHWLESASAPRGRPRGHHSLSSGGLALRPPAGSASAPLLLSRTPRGVRARGNSRHGDRPGVMVLSPASNSPQHPVPSVKEWGPRDAGAGKGNVPCPVLDHGASLRPTEQARSARRHRPTLSFLLGDADPSLRNGSNMRGDMKESFKKHVLRRPAIEDV